MPKNSLDRLRYLVLLKDETTIKDLGVDTKEVSPSRVELKDLEYSYCYLHHSLEDPKGWRNDGFRASWDCKSHWSYPMRGKLRRKIDKITIDASRELHRWATQLNTVPQNPATVVTQQNTLTLVEYFMKSKSKQLPITKSPFGATTSNATLESHKLSKHPGEGVSNPASFDKEFKRKSNASTPVSSTSTSSSPQTVGSAPSQPAHATENMLALLNYEATKELSHNMHGDYQGAMFDPHMNYSDSAFRAVKNVRPTGPPMGAMHGGGGMPQHGGDFYYRPVTPTYEYGAPPPSYNMNFRPVPEASFTPYPSAPLPPASPVPSSISPMDWNAWQQTLHSWAVYLDQLPPHQKAAIWNYCRSSPHFQPYDVDSFVGLWHRWSQSFHTNAPAISVFCSALDNFRTLFQGTDWRQSPTTVGYGDESQHDSLMRDRRSKVMDVSSLVM